MSHTFEVSKNVLFQLQYSCCHHHMLILLLAKQRTYEKCLYELQKSSLVGLLSTKKLYLQNNKAWALKRFVKKASLFYFYFFLKICTFAKSLAWMVEKKVGVSFEQKCTLTEGGVCWFSRKCYNDSGIEISRSGTYKQ